MANVLVTLTKTSAALPAGAPAQAGTTVVVTDSAGAVQTQTFTGVETPTPWSGTFSNLAAGNGTCVATDVDTSGATIGASVTTQAFSTGGTGAGTFQQTTGITVTAA